MKKIFSLLALFILFGCDDGDMTFETFNFAASEPRTCDNGLLYKVSGSEVLVLILDQSNFANVETPPGQPRLVSVSATSNAVQYLKYGADVGNSHEAVICNALPPFSPTEIWVADGGTISITTRADFDPDTQRVTGYTHTVDLVYLSFTRDGETIIIQDNEFGDVRTPLGYTFGFDATGVTLQTCPDNPADLYIINQQEVLRMMLNNAYLFTDVVTPEGSPREQVIDENNQILLDIYNGTGISQVQACGGQQLSPQLIAQWQAFEGKVQVTTTSNPIGGFEHEIKFVDMKFRNISNPSEQFTRTNYVLGDTYNQ